jgi:hypothetical protein
MQLLNIQKKEVEFSPFRLTAIDKEGRSEVYKVNIYSERELKDNMKTIKRLWSNDEITITRVSI